MEIEHPGVKSKNMFLPRTEQAFEVSLSYIANHLHKGLLCETLSLWCYSIKSFDPHVCFSPPTFFELVIKLLVDPCI